MNQALRRTISKTLNEWIVAKIAEDRRSCSDRKKGSRPLSRVLSWAVIPLGCASPRTSSDLPGSPCGPHVAAIGTARSPIWSCSRWGLPCHECYHPRGALLPHHFTLTGTACALLRRYLSVALSVGSRPPGVTWHLVLWSPDFPPCTCVHSDSLADSWERTIRRYAHDCESPAADCSAASRFNTSARL